VLYVLTVLTSLSKALKQTTLFLAVLQSPGPSIDSDMRARITVGRSVTSSLTLKHAALHAADFVTGPYNVGKAASHVPSRVSHTRGQWECYPTR
jgi:hypothetical protein